MKFTKIAIASILGLSMFSLAQAQQVEDSQKKKITENIVKVNPQVEILSVSKTPWDNVLEVVMKGNNIIYTNQDGSFIMATDGKEMILLDVKNRKNLTEEKISELNKIDYKAFNTKNAIQLQKGKPGQGEISVFADPNCIYCKRFEASLAQTPDITVNLYLYPVLGQDSLDKSKQVWCAKDQAKTWKEWMIDSKALPTGEVKCDTKAIEENLEFGKSIGINGTPTIVFTDGTRAAGAISPAALMKKINDISTKTSNKK